MARQADFQKNPCARRKNSLPGSGREFAASQPLLGDTPRGCSPNEALLLIVEYNQAGPLLRADLDAAGSVVVVFLLELEYTPVPHLIARTGP
jgi:hypothetical protein